MKALKDSVIYLIGEVFSKSMPFFLLPYLSKKLGVVGFGELSYYQTYLALFSIIIGLSQEGAVVRYFYFYGKRSLNLIVTTGYLYSLIVGIILLIGCYILNSEIMAYIVIATVFQSFISVQLSVRQCQKQALVYTIIQFFLAAFSVLLTIILLEVYSEDLISKRFLAILFANIIVFVIAYLCYSRKDKIKWRFSVKNYKSAVWYILAFGLPLILHNISSFMKGQLDRIFIYHQYTVEQLGVYTAGFQISSILLVVLTSINKALLPYYFDGIKNKVITKKNIYNWMWLSFIFIPFPPLISYFVPEKLYLLFLGEGFVGVNYYISLFLLGIGFVIPYLILVNYLFFYGANNYITLSSLLSVIFYFIALVLFSVIDVSFIPFSYLIGNLFILPVIYIFTKRI
ncbi:Lsg locus protein 1 [Chelonobacter oris]|uniref:oligosaccharide flippase family protein n=1 Tax=Chelonobacter oris TaxID=505317 RepID=UPI00244D643C|nr:oligosaccharide flippase family protein [Chelonobacter oris]MDH3000860.1 Lsg locus protein 1 [Chelonobacter oris]